MEQQPVPVEVVSHPQSSPKVEGSPVHALSAAILVVVDTLWTIPELVGLEIFVMVAAFLSVGVSTFLIQKFVNKDTTGRALAIAVMLGILAGLPFPVAGTAAGIFILGQTGLAKLKSSGG